MFVFFAALVSSASAAKFCCSSDQWEGDAIYVTVVVSQDLTNFLQGTLRVSYDNVNKIVAYNQTLMVHGQPVNQRMVNDHKNGVVYVMNDEGCHRTVAAPWLSGCIPDNATETIDNARYGLGDNSVKVKAYLIPYFGYEVYLAVTADTCAPVIRVYTGNLEARSGQPNASTTETIESVTYTNIRRGIADRSIFIVPAHCTAETELIIGRRSLFRI